MGCASSRSTNDSDSKTNIKTRNPPKPVENVSEKISTSAENTTKSSISFPPVPSPPSPQSPLSFLNPPLPLSNAKSDADSLNQNTQSQENSLEHTLLKSFLLNELKEATGGFSGDNLLGQGGFGKVYKGILPSNGGTEKVKIAVKRLKRDSNQGQQEWLAEILTLGRLSHPNLVRLHGYCTEEGEGILVYDYLPKGSLNYHLFPADNAPCLLPWETRLKIAYGTASALAYLHENRIIHRDFKAPNILLDAKFNPVLTDFGLAKILPPEATHTSTRVMGTLGYIDPKFCETGQLTTKSDVYAFGVLLLELLSGKKAKEDDVAITDWASPFLAQRDVDIVKMFDQSLIPAISSRPMHRIGQKIAVIAKYCVEVDPSIRPSMDEVMKIFSPLMKKFNELILNEASKAKSSSEATEGS